MWFTTNIQESLKPLAVIMTATCLASACANAPIPDPSLAPSPQVVEVTWPPHVERTCPQRRIPLECFRRGAIDRTMRGLSDSLAGCRRLGKVRARLRVETRGGVPSCVDVSPQDSEVAVCLAGVVARGFVLPASSPEERCSFIYPVSLN